MGKCVLECPQCGSYVEASNGFFGMFASKSVNCSCGYVINVKAERMASKECPHCGNIVIYDQMKGDKAICPVCNEKVNTKESMFNVAHFSCPTCSCKISVDKNQKKYTCNLCNTLIDVQEQLAKEKATKDGLASVIKYEGDPDTLIWKHPIEDFNYGSQLIVHESQEAIFFRDGQALDLFGPGRYMLETSQFPLMEKLYPLPSDPEKTFHSEVYFINKSQQMALKWGTSEKITMIDPVSQAPIAIGARGMFNFKVSNSRKLLLKLVGTTKGIVRNDIFGVDEQTSKNHAKDYFRSVIQMGVVTKLADAITENKIDILQIDQQKLQLSANMKEALYPFLDDYGMEITEFLIEGIILPKQGELGYDVVQTLIKLRQANLQKSVIATETDIKLSEMEAKKILEIRTEQNAAEVEKVHQETVAVKGQTEILETQIEGQKKVVSTQAEVEAEKMRMELEMQRKAQMAQIEAQEMIAKGYNQKDVLQADVMKAFAENQPEGGVGMGSIAGDALGMGMNFATMGAMAGLAGNMLGTGAQIGKDMTNAMNGTFAMGAANSSQLRNQSGENVPTQPPLQQIKIATEGWPGMQPDSQGWDCKCGEKGITRKFCPECGTKRPEPVKPDTWDCSCGEKQITSKFCPECGAKRPETVEPDTWDCSCGEKKITSKFCPECGLKRPENIEEGENDE